MSTQDLIPLLFAWLIYCAFWWFLITKFGWRGKARLIFLALMSVPPIHEALQAVSASCLIFLLIWPWPVYKELRQLRQMKKQRPGDDIDAELRQLRTNL